MPRYRIWRSRLVQQPDTESAVQPRQPNAQQRQLIDDYLRHLQTERGYSPHTLTNYRFDLIELARLAAARPWSDLGEQDIRRWVATRSRLDGAPRSIARTLSCWRGWFDWLGQRDTVQQNPARAVKAPKAGKRLPKALSPDMAAQLLQPSQASASFEQLRDTAILELLYSSGLRLSELTSLDGRYVEGGDYRSSSWIDLQQQEATVLGKGNKRRMVPVGGHAAVALEAWLQHRQQLPGGDVPSSDRAALFINSRGKRLSNRSVQAIVARRAQQQGVPTRVHPHVLRHSFASHLLQSSGDLRGVQELLGHANITTTQVYTSLDFQRLAAVYDAAHPRAKRKSP